MAIKPANVDFGDKLTRKNQIRKDIEEFLASDLQCAEIVSDWYVCPSSCVGSYKNYIRRYGYKGVIVRMKQNVPYLVKENCIGKRSD